MTITFAPAVKEQLKARVALAGPSGSGKTYTSLRFARGLAGDNGKIALIDTERRSASLYADEFQFDTLDFQAPYRPEGLRDAIQAAEKAGYDVLIIDSFTHFWSGPGGVLEIVDKNAKGGNSWSGWAVGTPVQQAVVDAMLTANLHVIVCMRSKQEWALQEDERGKKTPTRIGMGVQQRGDIEYEFTVFGELDLAHRLQITKSRCKQLADRVEPSPGEGLARELLAWLSAGADPDARFVEAGWSGERAHDEAKAGLVERVRVLPEATRVEFKETREARGLPSLANVTLLTPADVDAIGKLIVELEERVAGEAEGGAGDDPKAGEPPVEAPPRPAPQPRTTTEKSRAVKAVDPIGKETFDAFSANVHLLDPEYLDQFKADLFEAGLGALSANATRAQLAEAQGLLDIIEKRNKPLWDARRKAVFAALTKFDPAMAKDEAVRHQFVKDATDGATESTAKLSQAHADAIIGAAAGEPMEAIAS